MYSKDAIKDRRIMLRIKFNALMMEAAIIRHYEAKVRNGALRDELRNHRAGVLRAEARLTALTLGLLRGRTIDEMEPRRHTSTKEPDMKAIGAMLKKYGPKDFVIPTESRAARRAKEAVTTD